MLKLTRWEQIEIEHQQMLELNLKLNADLELSSRYMRWVVW